MATIIEMINYAIKGEKRLHVIYSNHVGYSSITIRPIKWISQDHILVYDYLSAEQKSISRAAIRHCRLIDEHPGIEDVASSPLDSVLARQIELEETHHEVITPMSNPETAIDAEYNQIDPANLPQSSPRLSRRKQTSSSSTGGIQEINNPEDWQHLLDFYRECLVHENRQEYIIDISRKDRFKYFDAPQDELEAFLNGQKYFSFHQEKNRELYKFVSPMQKRSNQQLCVGYPIFVTGGSKLAPVLIAPINVKLEKDSAILEAEEYEPSYAALASLGLRDEEILSILTSISNSLSQDKQLSIQSQVDLIIQMTGEALSEDLTSLKSTAQYTIPNTFVFRPCLFWVVPGTYTANLIRELAELRTLWPSVPAPLKSLINSTPEYIYPNAPTETKDRNIYVAPVYERQRQAIAASLAEPITVVTGPPGTGKSQFILNLIVQAVLRGENVLFASRNNKAVDVVMDRLQGEEIKFQGAIRAGNQEQRRYAIEQIAARLRELSVPAQKSEEIDILQDRYSQFQQQYLKKVSALKNVRWKSGLLTSRIDEVNELRKLVPLGMLTIVENLSVSFGANEYEYIQAFLSTQRTEALALKSSLDSLAEEITRKFSQDNREFQSIKFLQDFESQWGNVGADLLNPTDIETILRLKEFLRLWSDFLDAIENRVQFEALLVKSRELDRELEQRESNLSESEMIEARRLWELGQFNELLMYRNRARVCLTQSQNLAKRKRNIWVRLLAALGVRNPIKDIANELYDLQKQVRVPIPVPTKPSWQHLEELVKAAASFANICEVAFLKYQAQDTKEQLTKVRQALDIVLAKLPKSLSENVKKLPPTIEEIASARKEISLFIDQLEELISQSNNLRLEIQKKLEKNSDELEFLKILGPLNTTGIEDLWISSVDIDPDDVAAFLSNWRNILSYWNAKDGIRALQAELMSMPGEEALVAEARALGDSLFKLGGKILSDQWKKNTLNQNSSVFQRAEQFVSAARQSLESGSSASFAKDDNLIAVMKLFPVWATTNLSARSNFSLTPGLFDLIIIDEASQCDLPSALPLLYRAKRVVIVGDAMQLRHIAKILPNTENEVAAKHSVSQTKYSYINYSLFDIAHRSVQPKPSTILLDEHYRSDPQIFGFSREEFYPEELKIFTDISRFSLSEDYLKDGTGVFWVDTPGKAIHPSGGSAYNGAELKAISELVPKLFDDLKRRKMTQVKLGIISPYREQEKRLLNWQDNFQRSNPNTPDRITVGTAHKFQGDERDIVIFSPVLAEGLKEKSLDWLEKTSNLLNVAVSRARITLIVVGDWKFSLSLNKNSKYRALAEYVARHPSRVVESMDALPIFKGMPLDIFGVLLDRFNGHRNRLTLQKLLLSCNEYVWWMDKNISNGVFDLFIDIARHPDFKLKDIRILTSREQKWDERYPINPKLVKSVQEELARNGVTFTLGLLPRHEMEHDRHFYSAGYAINMPPFGGASGEHKMVSEYTESKTKRNFFESYWAKAEKH